MPDLEHLTEEQLEAMLLDATSGRHGGRQAMARVTAIRTILRRRQQQRREVEEENARRALAIVNSVRGPDAQLTELHPVDVASVLADPNWAPLVMSDEEMAARSIHRKPILYAEGRSTSAVDIPLPDRKSANVGASS